MGKSYRHIYKLLAFYILTGISVACTSEDAEPWTEDRKTASVTLRIPMLDASTRVEGTAEENAIHKLRVIITSGDVFINQAFDDAELTNGTVTINDVPVGTVQMYVIANEASIGKDYTDFTKWKEDVVDVNGSRKLLVKDENRTCFPARSIDAKIETDGLPMSWQDKQLVIAPPSGTPQVIDVELERAVAKLNIVMNNTLSNPITITTIELGTFFGDQLYLFREQYLDIPDETGYDGKVYNNLSVEIGANSSMNLVCYIYPSYAWKPELPTSPYTIGFTTTQTEYDAIPFIDNIGALNSIVRNTQVNIYATLSSDANISLSFKVEEWITKDVTVPSFD